MKQIHDKIDRLFEINRSLTQLLQLEDILKRLVEAAFDLIENADTVILYSLKEDGLLHFAQGVGVDEKMMAHVRFSPGESLTGQVFLTHMGVIASGAEMKEYMSSMTDRNSYYFSRGVFQREIKSIIAVPLIYKEDCIGILVVDNFDEEHVQFSKSDIQVMEIIADQAAIAIMNSKLYQQVKRKNKELSFSLDIHRKFTKILLEGKGEAYILDTISRILETPVTYSETSNNRPNDFPIINSNEVFGYFTLQRSIEDLSNIQKSALEHAANAMALEFVKQNTLFEKEMHLREELFHEILNGASTELALKIFGFSDTSKIACMIIDAKEGILWDMNTILQKKKLVKAIEQILVRQSGSFIVFSKSFQIVILIDHKKPINEKRVAEEIEMLINKSKPAAIGMGRQVPLTELADSYYEASEAVAYCKNVKSTGVITYSELGIERLWINSDRSLLKKFVDDKIGRLFEMEPEYLFTMKVFISQNKSHKETASVMHIHPNTLSYRLKKIENKLEIDLNRGEDWINTVIAFQIADYLTH